MRSPERRTAFLVVLVGAAGFALLVWWLVPWDPVGREVTPARATDVFSAKQIERAESYSSRVRLWSWGSLAVSLAVACWLGFTSVGSRVVGRVPGPRWLVIVLAVVGCELAGRLATLPFAIGLQRERLDGRSLDPVVAGLGP